MVTKEDVCNVTIFAGLDPADCERLARAASDLSLVEGEYAAPEGAERALFAVLDGKIEVVKLVDGVERVVGEREVGTSSARCRSRSARCSRSASGQPCRHA